ncbi:hypothetical protein Tpen_1015 [Thermofilum pendens Hrk 5]|uniref:DUF2240 family protein n=2 Tax=Thermofilum pendens TaxID=2269 RepID=A1RYY5_THEPD|nr:hypothetical protein Tpen_1015 [Thermofilum pendens Hrk 5]
MDEIEEYARRLGGLIREKGRLTVDEILDWGQREGLNSLTLYMVVESLLEDASFKPSGERRVIDSYLNLELPEKVEYVAAKAEEKAGEVPAKAPPRPREEKGRKPKKQPPRVKPSRERSLLEFFGEEREEPSREEPVERGEEGGEEPERREEPAPEPAAEPRASVGVQEVDCSEVSDLLGNEAYERALRYLCTYWSIGLLRLMDDLIRMGVKEPRKFLAELAKRGLIEVTELEVVNAKEKLLKLSECFGKDRSTLVDLLPI